MALGWSKSPKRRRGQVYRSRWHKYMRKCLRRNTMKKCVKMAKRYAKSPTAKRASARRRRSRA